LKMGFDWKNIDDSSRNFLDTFGGLNMV